jgi:hypothetical protein
VQERRDRLIFVSPGFEHDACYREEVTHVGNLGSLPALVTVNGVRVRKGVSKSIGENDRQDFHFPSKAAYGIENVVFALPQAMDFDGPNAGDRLHQAIAQRFEN